MTPKSAQITQHIEEWLQSHLEGTDIFVVEVQYFPKRDKIQLFVDADSHIGIEACVRISRYLEPLLENSGLLGQNYTLEVSSPGVGTPFKQRRQYPKAIGKVLIITLSDRTTIEGTLQAVSDTELTLLPLPQKSNKAIPLPLQIPFSTIHTTEEKIVF